MAVWYVSSVAYAALPAFQTSHAYSVGDIIRPTAAAAVAQYPQRCTTAGNSGGSEPTWSTSNNGTTSTGTAVFTNVGGQSTYGWSAACGTVDSLSNNAATKGLPIGDQLYASHDHSESAAATNYMMSSGSASYVSSKMISVDRGGSVPPTASDRRSGASISVSGQFVFDTVNNPHYWDGFTFTITVNNTILFNNSGSKANYFKNCAFVFSNASGGSFNNGNYGKVVLENTTVQFANANGKFQFTSAIDFTWLNTPSAIAGATIPTTLFNNTGSAIQQFTCRGVDLSAITGTIVAQTNGNGSIKALFEGCKINASATKYSTPGTGTTPMDEVEYVNCFNGTNIFSSRHTPTGTLTTDTTTYMSGGTADDVGGFSHKMVSTANVDLAAVPFESFWLDIENTAVGSALTATVEIVSSASLNNTDVKLQLEYQGTSGSSVATFTESNSNILTATSALTSSSATWNSPPSTPVYQKLQITFTPQQAGRVRGRVLLGKASTTVWINPQIVLS